MSVATGVGYLASQIINPQAAGPAAVSVDQFAQIIKDIEYRFSIVADVLQAADRSAANSVSAATDAATQAEVIGQDVKDTTERIVDTIIPHSMAWLSGYLVSHFISPLEVRVTKLESSVAFLLGWRGQIDSWRRDFVDPNVEKWVGWKQWFDGWPQSVVFTVKAWLDDPNVFAQWAAAPLVGPIVSYLAAPEHKQTRDNLTDIMSQAWRDNANTTFDDFLAWLVAGT